MSNSVIGNLNLFLLSLAIMVPTSRAANPVPLVNWPLTPAAVAPAGAGFTLIVHGTGFVSGSVVRWNGSPRPTTFVNKSKLTASIPATDISHAKTSSITVFNPSPGGGSSNVVFFQVRIPGSWAAFSPPVQFTAGAGPESLVIGDFNKDNKLDLAVPNPNSNNVSILMGNGDGTFKPSVEYSVGQGPIVAAVGDFNHDGKLDLVVANNFSNNLSVLLGNSDGTFQAAVEHSVGTNPAAVAVGDFNRDGKLDVVVSNQGSNNISVLLGDGTGSFHSVLTYAVGQNPVGVAVGDFNRDGKLDLAVANNDSNSVSVLLGNGDGTFQAAVDHGGVPNAASLTTADLNSDGKLDLVVANSLGFDVAILLGNGDGTFQAAKTYSTDDEPTLALGDLNGDGKLDLAIADIGASNITTLLGNGKGAFQETVSYIVPVGVTSVTVGDFNGDGKLDLAAADGSSGISVLLQNKPLSGPNATLSSTTMQFECRNTRAGCECFTQSSLTLSNYGNKTLNINGTSITGPFSQANNCGTTLQPGRFCTISVTWLEQEGSGSGTLSITDNAPGSPQMVSLLGERLCTPLAPLARTQSGTLVLCSSKSLSSH